MKDIPFRLEQAVKLKNRNGSTVDGKYKGFDNMGPGKGRGVYLLIEVDGQIKRSRLAAVTAA